MFTVSLWWSSGPELIVFTAFVGGVNSGEVASSGSDPNPVLERILTTAQRASKRVAQARVHATAQVDVEATGTPLSQDSALPFSLLHRAPALSATEGSWGAYEVQLSDLAPFKINLILECLHSLHHLIVSYYLVT